MSQERHRRNNGERPPGSKEFSSAFHPISPPFAVDGSVSRRTVSAPRADSLDAQPAEREYRLGHWTRKCRCIVGMQGPWCWFVAQDRQSSACKWGQGLSRRPPVRPPASPRTPPSRGRRGRGRDGTGDEGVLLRHQPHHLVFRDLALVQAHLPVLHRAPGEQLLHAAHLPGEVAHLID